jgi:hypothetical protein
VGLDVDERHTGLLGQSARELVLEDESQAHERLAEQATVLATLDQRLGELGVGDQPFLDQQLTELETRLLAQGDGSWVARPHWLTHRPPGPRP